MRIGAEVIASLGVSLGEVADALEATKDAQADRWALRCGRSSEAFDDLVAGWRRNRLLLVEVLRDLGDKAQVAGAAYVETEATTTPLFGGPTR